MRRSRGRWRASVLVKGAVALSVVTIVAANAIGGGGGGGGGVGCTTTLSSGANVASTITAAASGSTICLNAGTYPAITVNTTKTSYVTVKASPGLAASAVTVGQFDAQASRFLRLQGVTVNGGLIGNNWQDGSNALHVQIRDSRFTNGLCILQPEDAGMDVLIDGNTFGDLGQSCTEGRIGTTAFNEPRTPGRASGITISNNTIGPGGQADGIQNCCEIRGVVIQGNHFDHIQESGGTHADGIQDSNGLETQILGNWFDKNAESLLTQESTGTIIKNNVIDDVGSGNPFSYGQVSNVVLEHNTFINGSSVRLDAGSSNGLIRNNVFKNVGIDNSYPPGCTGCTIAYNMFSTGLQGTNAIAGTPTFVGGSTPTTYAGFALAAGSVGKNAASDGTDLGAFGG